MHAHALLIAVLAALFASGCADLWFIVLKPVSTCIMPMQVMIVPISEASQPYAKEVRSALRGAGLFVDADCSDRKMQKKVGMCVDDVVLALHGRAFRHAVLACQGLLLRAMRLCAVQRGMCSRSHA